MANNENNSDTERIEKLFDAMLKVAAEEATKKEMDDLPSREELDKIFPRTQAFDKRVAKIINKHERVANRKQALKDFYRIAAIFCIFLTVATTTLMSVEASRNFIRKTIFNIRDNHVAFEFWQDGISEQGNELIVGYIPDGFEPIGRRTQEGMRGALIYDNDNGQQIIIQKDSADVTARFFRTDDMDFTITTVRGHEAYLFESFENERFNRIMWVDDIYIITVLADVEIDELLKIAESITIR